VFSNNDQAKDGEATCKPFRAEISATYIAARCCVSGCCYRVAFNFRKRDAQWVCTKVTDHTCQAQDQVCAPRLRTYNYTAAQLVPAVLADVQQDRGCSPTALVKNLQPYVGSVVTPHFAGKVKAAACELLDKKSGITYGKLRPFGKKVGELGIGAVDIVVYNGAEMRAALLKRAKAEYEEQRKHHNKKHTDAPRPPWTDDMVDVSHVTDDGEYLAGWNFRPAAAKRMWPLMQHVAYADGAHGRGDARGTFLCTVGLDVDQCSGFKIPEPKKARRALALD